MSEPPRTLRVAVAPEESVTALAYAPTAVQRAGITLILAHGAGAGQTSGFMVAFARSLAERGIDTVTFNFLYTEHRRRIPDPAPQLEACYRAVIEALRADAALGKQALAIGGKSMGGRIASHLAAAGLQGLLGLVFLGYPLHPPGQPERLRVKHLPAIAAPMLFVQGARDSFGTPEELRPVLARLTAPAELHVIEGGDHSLKVPKSAGLTQDQVHGAIQGKIAGWLRDRCQMTDVR